MLTLGIEDTVEGEIRNKLKKLGKQDWTVHHREALDGSMGRIGRTGEKQQGSHLDGPDLPNEI